jgi:hypothetical protein
MYSILELMFTKYAIYSQVMFLEWNSEQLMMLSRFAVRHFVSKVMHAWLAVSTAMKQQQEVLIDTLPSLLVHRYVCIHIRVYICTYTVFFIGM